MRPGGIRTGPKASAWLRTTLTALVALAVLSACGDSDDSRPEQTATAPGGGDRFGAWHRVGTRGDVIALAAGGYGDVYAIGPSSIGGPLFLALREGRLRRADGLGEVARLGGIDAVSVGSESIGVRQGEHLSYGDVLSDDLSPGSWTQAEVPVDERGRAPEWFVPILDGEGDARVAGAVPDGRGGWSLRGWAETDQGWSAKSRSSVRADM